MTDLNFLKQMIMSMNEAVDKLEKAKQEGDSVKFNKIKVLISELSKKIDSEIV